MPPRAEFIAHRGSSYLAPENTLASFALGWEETTTCELDVRMTNDGKVIVIHDDSTKRTTGIDRKISESSLSDLQKLDAGSFKGEKWKGEKLPSLEEVVAAMPENKKLLIEIKAGPEIIPELVRVIHDSGKAKQVLLQSFYEDVCGEIKKLLPDLAVYLLVACRQDLKTKAWLPTIEHAIAATQAASLDGMGVNDTPLITASAVAEIHAAKLKLNLWTIDQPDQARKLAALGVDGIITNRPAWLRGQLPSS